MKKLYWIAGMMLVALPCLSKNYYVSLTGDNSHSGTRQAPFRTLTHAASVMKPGDVCYVREGRYLETVRITQDGTQEQPLTFKAYRGDEVVIDATQVIDGWKPYRGTIYQVKKQLPLSGVYNTLFYQGKLMDHARFPNNTDHDAFTLDAHPVSGGDGKHFELKDFPQMDMVGGYFCYMGSHSGCSWTREITAVEPGVIHHAGVDTKKWPYTPHNPQFMTNKNRGQLYVFGKLSMLDYPQEWHYEESNQTLYAIFPEGKAPQQGEVRVNARETTLEIDGDHVHFEGINCFGGEVRVRGNHCRLAEGKFQECSQSLKGLIGISAQSNTGSLLIYGSDAVIEDNLIEGGRASGIAMLLPKTSQNHRIENNVVRYFNTIGIHANPIRSNCPGTRVIHNSIYTCGRDGVMLSGSGCELAYNDVFDCLKINNDGGIFYTVGNTELKHTRIHHNWFHDSFGPKYTDGRVAGIYLDNNSKGYDVYRNIISNISWGGVNINWHNTDIKVYHNTIWNAGYSMERWALHYKIERIEVVNNIANVKAGREGDEWIGTDIRTNLITQESPFKDLESNDFRPARRSAVVDAGEVIANFAQPRSGKRADLGALEYGQHMWKVGASWADKVMPEDFVYDQKRSDVYGADKLKKKAPKETEEEIFFQKGKR